MSGRLPVVANSAELESVHADVVAAFSLPLPDECSVAELGTRSVAFWTGQLLSRKANTWIDPYTDRVSS